MLSLSLSLTNFVSIFFLVLCDHLLETPVKTQGKCYKCLTSGSRVRVYVCICPCPRLISLISIDANVSIAAASSDFKIYLPGLPVVDDA